jgi:hypothetical protein
MPLWHKACFEVKALEKQQIQKRPSGLRSSSVGLNAGPTTESLHQPFFEGFFEIGLHELFAPGWLQTSILLISAS